jgi:hypothetical protein
VSDLRDDLAAIDAIDDVYKQLVDEYDQLAGDRFHGYHVEQLEGALATEPGTAALYRLADGEPTLEDVHLLVELELLQPGEVEGSLRWLEQLEAVRQEAPEAMYPNETQRHLRRLHSYRWIAAQLATPSMPRRQTLPPPVAPSWVRRLIGRAPRSRAVRAPRQRRTPARPEDDPPRDSAGPR